jgi:hypothetical protein
MHKYNEINHMPQEIKERVEWIGDRQLNASTGFTVEKWCCGGVPAREWEPPATYRLGLFMRWVEKPQEGHQVG